MRVVTLGYYEWVLRSNSLSMDWIVIVLATISILQYELNLISYYVLIVGSSGALWLNTVCVCTCTQQGIYV